MEGQTQTSVVPVAAIFFISDFLSLSRSCSRDRQCQRSGFAALCSRIYSPATGVKNGYVVRIPRPQNIFLLYYDQSPGASQGDSLRIAVTATPFDGLALIAPLKFTWGRQEGRQDSRAKETKTNAF